MSGDLTWLLYGSIFLAVCLIVSVASLFAPPPPRWLFAPRWAQGWLVPHAEPQERCRVNCGTCS